MAQELRASEAEAALVFFKITAVLDKKKLTILPTLTLKVLFFLLLVTAQKSNDFHPAALKMNLSKVKEITCLQTGCDFCVLGFLFSS